MIVGGSCTELVHGTRVLPSGLAIAVGETGDSSPIPNQRQTRSYGGEA
jgi:hypothetical protein